MNKHARKSLTRTALFGALLVLAMNLVAGPAVMAMVSESDSVTGTVMSTPDGYVIDAGSEYYLVVGLDLSEMVTKTVEVTGTVSEGAGGKEIFATSVEEL